MPQSLINIRTIEFLKIGFRETRRERKKEREGGRKRERELFHLFMHSLVDSSVCPDQGANPQPWRIRTML